MKTMFKIGMIVSALVLILAGLIAGLQAVEEDMASGSGSDDVTIAYKGHVDVYRIPAGTGKQILVASKDNLLVDNGKNFIRKQIGDDTSLAANSTKYISLSNDASSPAAGWLQIPAEISTNGLARAQATYQVNGTGAWNYTYTWIATGAQSVQLTGLNYAPGNTSENLFASLQFTPTSLQANDQLKVVWSISVS